MKLKCIYNKHHITHYQFLTWLTLWSIILLEKLSHLAGQLDFLLYQNIYYYLYNSPPLVTIVSILSDMNPIFTLICNLFKINLNIILPPVHVSPKCFLPFRFFKLYDKVRSNSKNKHKREKRHSRSENYLQWTSLCIGGWGIATNTVKPY